MIENLPNYYKKNSGFWLELDNAFKATTKDFNDISLFTKNSYLVNKANLNQIRQLEDLFKIKADNNRPIEHRQGAIIAKLMPLKTTKKSVMILIKQFYPNHDFAYNEQEEDYCITLSCLTMRRIPINMTNFVNTIEEILQADISIIIDLNVSMSSFTHKELEISTQKELQSYWQETLKKIKGF